MGGDFFLNKISKDKPWQIIYKGPVSKDGSQNKIVKFEILSGPFQASHIIAPTHSIFLQKPQGPLFIYLIVKKSGLKAPDQPSRQPNFAKLFFSIKFILCGDLSELDYR